MATKTELEEIVKKRVKPLVEDAMHKFLGITISEIEEDISDKLKTSLLDFEINTKIPFKKAKKAFKKAYLARLLKTYSGNISDIAKASGIDRRSIHRMIIDFKIKIEQFRQQLKPEYVKHAAVQSIVQKAFDTYKPSINPKKFKDLYEHAPLISRNIVKELPKKPLTFKQAEKEFEKEYLIQALKEHKTITKTAKKIGLRFETLHRKLKSLNLL